MRAHLLILAIAGITTPAHADPPAAKAARTMQPATLDDLLSDSAPADRAALSDDAQHFAAGFAPAAHHAAPGDKAANHDLHLAVAPRLGHFDRVASGHVRGYSLLFTTDVLISP